MYQHPAERQIDELIAMWLEHRLTQLDPTVEEDSRRGTRRGPVGVPLLVPFDGGLQLREDDFLD